MNSKELRRQAEYIVEQWDNHDRFRMVEGDAVFMNADGEPDSVTFARHILSTVRDDDDELLDFAFLHGVKTKYFGEALMCSFDFGCLHMWIVGDEYSPLDAIWSFCDANLQLTVKTRGQFRSLCRGLGIELKETTC